MPITLTQEYSRALAALEGAEFQAEVNARLASILIGFQTIPSKPHGDAGLDGLSHNGTRAYCCYGLEHNGFKNNKSRERAVVKKFAGDLRRLFELETNGQALVHKATPELATILAPGQRLQHVELITNWFESHRVIGPIAAKLEEYKKVSQCRYVRLDASAVVVGPADLANRYAVDEATILRATQRVFIRRVHEVAQTISIDDPGDFDAKIEVLRQLRPDQLPAIESLAEEWRVSWRMALAFERELDTTDSRPHVCDDNPYSESQFKTLKYRPEFPARFGTIQQARDFCRDFFDWYNRDHRHSGIGLHTPADVHYLTAITTRRDRSQTLEAAHALFPERFPNGKPVPPPLPEAVWINPPEKENF